MKSLLENIDLMTYTINFNYQKKAVYHTIFGIFISICVYAFIIVLFRYFAKDFINKSNPRIIYQETEFMNSITIPINFIVREYNYIIYFESKENFFNVNSSEGIGAYKFINSTTNDLFYFTLRLTDRFNLTELRLIDKIDIQSKRISKNEEDCFINYIQFNKGDRKFNLTIANNTDLTNFKSEDNILYDNYNFTINPQMIMELLITYNKKLENVVTSFSITFGDSIINVNNQNFFRNYSDEQLIKFNSNLNVMQMINLNYGVVRLIDDSGIIFSEIKENFSLKKNYQSFDSNYNDKNTLFKIEFSPIMKQYERIYKKLQNVFADLGGLFNSLILIGNILVAQFNKSNFDYNLINNTFFLDNEEVNINNNKNKNINFNNNNDIHNKHKIKIQKNLSMKKIDNIYNNKKLYQNFLLNNTMKNPVNKHIISKSNIDSKILMNNNDYSNKTIIENNSSNLSHINDLIKEDNNQTKLIDESSSRLKIQLENDKKKENDKSKVNTKENCFKFPGIKENDIILDKRIGLLVDEKKKRINRKKFVKFSRFEFFLKFIPCKRIKNKSLIEREELISKGEDKIAEYLDVCSYTNLIENLEKLKMILLNDYQKLSFEFLKNRNPSDLFKEDFNSKILKTIKYFKQKIEESQLCKTDKYMLENFSREFKDLIIL